MMKKILAFVIALLLLFPSYACNRHDPLTQSSQKPDVNAHTNDTANSPTQSGFIPNPIEQTLIQPSNEALQTGTDQTVQSLSGNIIDTTSMGNYAGHVVGVNADGTVVATGDNSFGQCDVSEWRDIVAVSAGQEFTVGLKKDGTVLAVGNNSSGQCEVAGWEDIIAVAAGSVHTVGVKKDGSVITVGENNLGCCDVYEWSDIIAISANINHTVGIRADGKVVSAGKNNGVSQHDVSDWRDIVAISVGPSHVVGLRKDGTVGATGNYNDGRCDVSEWHDIIAISAGGGYTIGLVKDGSLVMAGYERNIEDFISHRNSSGSGVFAIAAGTDTLVWVSMDGRVGDVNNHFFQPSVEGLEGGPKWNLAR